ncbi:MAG: hypothetical protein WAL95_15575 [Candidatus Acidiferrales bacterium]
MIERLAPPGVLDKFPVTPSRQFESARRRSTDSPALNFSTSVDLFSAVVWLLRRARKIARLQHISALRVFQALESLLRGARRGKVKKAR